MKELFQQYYPPEDSKWGEIWDNSIFILDTNVLLNLFRYNKETSDDLLKALKTVAERLWIPHQVALEYHENLQYVTIGQLNIYTEVDNILESAKSNLHEKIDGLRLADRHYSIDPKKILTGVDKVIGDFQKEISELKDQQPNYHERLSYEVQSLLTQRIGSAPDSQSVLDDYYKEAEERFKLNRPPGYLDRAKGNEGDRSKKSMFFHNDLCYQRQYGDVLIWFQIIEMAKRGKHKNIIFVTDDNKEDWWRRIGGRQMGPRYELMDEIRTKANVDLFHMYTSVRFLSVAQQKLHIDVKKESIEQIRAVTSMSNQRFTEQQYTTALESVELTDIQMAILQEHCNAYEYIDSASNLAKKLGYGHYSKVSNNYSRLSEQLGTAIGYQPDVRNDGSKIWWPVLYEEAGAGSPIPLRLHSNFVQALLKSGIVK